MAKAPKDYTDIHNLIRKKVERNGMYVDSYPIGHAAKAFLKANPDHEALEYRAPERVTGQPVFGPYGKLKGWGGTREDPGSYKIVKKEAKMNEGYGKKHVTEDFSNMSDEELNGWVNRRLKNSMATNLTKERESQLKDAQKEVRKRKRDAIKESVLGEAKSETHYFHTEPTMQDVNYYSVSAKTPDEAKQKLYKHINQKVKNTMINFHGERDYDSMVSSAKQAAAVEKNNVHYHGTKPRKYLDGKYKNINEETMNEDYLHTDLLKAGAIHAKGMSNGNRAYYNAYLDHTKVTDVLKKHGYKPQHNYTDFKHANGSTVKLTHGGNGSPTKVSHISVNYEG